MHECLTLIAADKSCTTSQCLADDRDALRTSQCDEHDVMRTSARKLVVNCTFLPLTGSEEQAGTDYLMNQLHINTHNSDVHTVALRYSDS